MWFLRPVRAIDVGEHSPDDTKGPSKKCDGVGWSNVFMFICSAVTMRHPLLQMERVSFFVSVSIAFKIMLNTCLDTYPFGGGGCYIVDRLRVLSWMGRELFSHGGSLFVFLWRRNTSLRKYRSQVFTHIYRQFSSPRYERHVCHPLSLWRHGKSRRKLLSESSGQLSNSFTAVVHSI